MAKLYRLPEQSVIDGLKGKIDFYVWNGIPVARSWPRSPGHDRAPAVQAAWEDFTWASQNWNSLSPIVQDAYRSTASQLFMSGRDLFTKSYINDYFRYGQWGSDYESSPPVPKIAILDVQYVETANGYEFTVTTNIACHLFMYYTVLEPWIHREPYQRRGYLTVLGYRFCFVSYHKNEQEEAGDTLSHTFIKEPWPMCETRWFLFRGQISGKWSKSCSPVFKLHRPIAEYGPPQTLYFYPDKHPEVSSVDSDLGAEVFYPGDTWTFLRNGGDEVLVHPSGDVLIARILAYNVSNMWRRLSRNIIVFDTTIIPPGSLLDSMYLGFYPYNKSCPAQWPDFSLCVVLTNPASDTDVIPSDWNTIEFNSLANIRSFASIVLNTYNWFTFTPYGIAHFVAGQKFKMGIMENSYDRLNVAPPWGPSRQGWVSIYAADSIQNKPPILGVTFRPKL